MGDDFDLLGSRKEDKAQLKQEERILKEEIRERKSELNGLEADERKVESQLHHGAADEPPLDLGKVWSWVVKNKALFLILIPMFLAVFVRVGTMDMPVANEWAANSVHGFIKGDIANVINAKFPNLPEDVKTKRVDEQFTRAITEGSYNIQTGQYAGQTLNIANEVANNAAQLKQFWQYDLNGKQVTYMPDIDPYYFLRYARNYLDHGYIGDYINDKGEEVDSHKRAPFGTNVESYFLPVLIAWNHKIASMFSSNTDLMQTASLLPIIIAVLTVIPAFFIGRRIAGNIGGFFAAVMMSVNLAALNRTLWGHPDSDGFNLFFPLVVVWFSIEAFYAKKIWQKATYSGLAGLFVGLYTYAWTGWWYIFDFMCCAFAVVGAVILIREYLTAKSWKVIDPRHNKNWMNILLLIVFFVGFSGVFVTAFAGFSNFIQSPLSPLEFASIKNAAKPDLWPNVYTTVAEMNTGSYDVAVAAVGGKFFFAIALLGIALLCLEAYNKKEPLHIFTAVLLSIWLIGSIYAVTKGVRFTLLVAPAFAVAFGAAIGLLASNVSEFARSLRTPRWILTTIVVAFAVFLVWQGPLSAAAAEGVRDVPIMNDAWWAALTKIKDNSTQDAIINSWWDYGHHFKYVADRAVTFDGASQNSPMAHWIGLALLTDNEDQAAGILRMLDCGSRTGVDRLDEAFNDTPKTVALMKKAILLDKEGARKLFMENGVSAAKADEVLKLTHCSPPENYFITSGDMIGKAGVWAHFGSWDFEKAYAYLNLRSADKDTAVADLVKEFNYTEEKASDMYYEVQGIDSEEAANRWISPWPGYLGGLADCSVKNEMVLCGNGVRFNASSGRTGFTVQGRDGIPASASFIDMQGKFVVKRYNDSNMDFSAAIIPSASGFKSVVMSPELAGSMFTRLYFFHGHGLRHFDLFDRQYELSNGEILVWKVDWTGASENDIFKVAEQEVQNVNESVSNTTVKNGTRNSTTPKTIVNNTLKNTSIRTNVSNGTNKTD